MASLRSSARNRESKSSFQFREALARTFATTSKQLVWFYAINGVAWIWCSYILAFMGKTQVVESLSSNVCTIVIGQMGFYLVTKTVENVFKYNLFPWSKERASEPDTYKPDFTVPTTPPFMSNDVSAYQADVYCNEEDELNVTKPEPDDEPCG